MSARTTWASLALSLLSAATVAAKPPGLPAHPQTEGRERTPVEQAYHMPGRPAPPLGFVTVWPSEQPTPLTPAQMEIWRGLNRLPADWLGLALPWLNWY
jgi:hypothetical protein